MTALKKLAGNDLVLLAARLVVGGLLLYACVDKILHPADFATSIRNYRFLPDALVNLWAMTLPWVELLTGLALVAGFRPRGAGLVSTLLFLSFVIALSAALVRGLDISCGCFKAGEAGATIGPLYVVRDACLTLASALVLAFGGGRFAVGRVRDPGSRV